MRHLEPSRRVWLVKLGAITGMAAVAMHHGYFPVRALRLGTDDEAAPYIDDLARFAVRGRWGSKDGAVDYEAGLRAITSPTFSLTSAGDRLYCRPESARRMLEPLARCTHHCIAQDDAGGRAPGHMGMLTAAASRDGWRRALGWLGER
jgi:pimeloyl-ACP methyl ester carboxylesterase